MPPGLFQVVLHRKPGDPTSPRRGPRGGTSRSEEHTSELQSRQYLVCRLLLEKKNNAEPVRLRDRPSAPLGATAAAAGEHRATRAPPQAHADDRRAPCTQRLKKPDCLRESRGQ